MTTIVSRKRTLIILEMPIKQIFVESESITKQVV